MNRGFLTLTTVCATLACCQLIVADVGLRAPEGFEVSLYAGDELAHDIYSMTIDPKGRIVVAGHGYVKILHDTDDDGRADKATLFSEFPKSGAHGMVFVGNDLIATGDNLLMRLKDEDGDGVADGKPIPLANVRSPEHGVNGLVQGPDGWIYLIAGNDAGIGAQFARTKSSPVNKPQAGAVVRFSPDFKTSEVFAHGFRNPYDLAFNENGQLFTVDADGERDQYLPWYTPTRLFDIQQGMHHGWVQRGWTRSWNRPEYFFDNVERVTDIGRGSPTGVECYRHHSFPAKYRGSIFSCCWTLGTVYHFPLQPVGASYASKKDVFLQTTGDVGFAPVDLVVGPQGDMFVAIGGRGTRGSVFRVRYTGELKKEEQPLEAKDDLDCVLNAPQPLAAWSRAKWMPLADKIGKETFLGVAVNDQFSVAQRVRAIEIAREMFGGLPAFIDDDVFTRDDELVRSRAIWALAAAEDRAQEELEHDVYRDFFKSPHGMSSDRAFWESFATWHVPVNESAAMFLTFGGEPRRTRTARQLAAHANAQRLGLKPSPWVRVGALDDLLRRGLVGKLIPLDFREAVALFDSDQTLEVRPDDDREAKGEAPDDLEVAGDEGAPTTLKEFLERDFPEINREGVWLRRDADKDEAVRTERRRTNLELLRVMQLCLGDVRVQPSKPDVHAGYTANEPLNVTTADRTKAARVIEQAFPSGDADTDRELARTIGMLEVEGEAVERFAAKLTGCWSLRSNVQDDIHYLIVLSRLHGKRTEEMTEATAAALAFLHMKMLLEEMYPSRNWPLRVGEAFVQLCRQDPKLAETLATHRDFGMPAHAMFAKLMPEKPRKLATRRMLERAQRLKDDATWTSDMILLVADLGDEAATEAIRDQWHNVSLRDAIVTVVCRNPHAKDRALCVSALRETNAATVTRAAEALSTLGQKGTAEEIRTALTALRHHSADKKAAATRVALGKTVSVLSGQSFEFEEESDEDISAAYRPAFDWFAEAHPAEATKLEQLAAQDGIDWPTRIASIDFTQADPARGAKIYERQSCAKCHSGRNRLGPALEGVTGRWSRTDLIKEIVDPNRNVAPQFLTSRLETKNGKVYQGVPIYQSPDGTLLQTGPNETIRIAGPEVVSITKSRTSLMPTGLLRGLSDQDVADLYAYLKTLTLKPQ